MKITLIIFCFVFSLTAQSQIPDYYVYLISGSATIVHDGAKAVPVKQKTLVYSQDELDLKNNAEITLSDKDGNFYVWKNEGKITASMIPTKIPKKKNEGYTAKYCKLLYHELVTPSHDYETFKKEHLIGGGGVVDRGDNCAKRIYPVSELKTSSPSMVFRWRRNSSASAYLLSIFDQDGQKIKTLQVKDTVVVINRTRDPVLKPGRYSWMISNDKGACDNQLPMSFILLDSEQEKEMINSFASGSEDTSLETELFLVDNLVKHNFIDAAREKYNSLLKKYPNDSVLRKTYAAFLLKYGFEKEAGTVWK